MNNQPQRRGFERPVIATQNISPLAALNIAVGAASADRTYELFLTDIIVDPDIQVRVGGLDSETLAQYIAVLENEGELPPITVFRADDGEHYLADGFHRYAAHEEVGKALIKAYVKEGNRDQALDFAEGANLEHGLKLSNEDKENILFRRMARKGHPWQDKSNGQLAQALGVSKPTIARWMQKFATVTNVTVDRSQVVGADGRQINTGNITAANEARTNNPIPDPSPQAGKGDPLAEWHVQVGSPGWISWVHDRLEEGDVPDVPSLYEISEYHNIVSGTRRQYLWQKQPDGRLVPIHRPGFVITQFKDAEQPVAPMPPRQANSDLPQGYQYAPLDTGNGEASAIATDELAARRREGLVRDALHQVNEGVDNLLQNHSVRILNEDFMENRTALVAVIISAMVRETEFIQQLLEGMDLTECTSLQVRLGRVDRSYDELAKNLDRRIRELGDGQ